MSIYSNHLFTPGSQNNSWSHLNNYIKPGARVLDVGCSSGHFGEALRQIKNCEVVGIDLDENDIELAKKVLNRAVVMDINDTKKYAKLGLFDVVIFADVIEHLIDPRTTLENVKKLLSPSGVVIFSVPHMAHVSVRLQLLTGVFPYKNRGLLDQTHLHFYDRNELESVFADAGYTLQDMNPVVSGMTDKQYEDHLKKLGLAYTPEFRKAMEDSGANIFQFIGMAAPSKTNKPSKRNLEYRMPQDELLTIVQENIARANALEQDNQALHAQLDKLNHRLNNRAFKIPHYSKAILRRAKKLVK